LVWKIEISETAKQQLSKLDQPVSRRILKFLSQRLGKLDDPRSIGKALHGSRLGEFWRYRVGDYRIIGRIENDYLVVLVLRIGHRHRVYR
jgi:mRNA interferase RelE/StbE